MVFNATFNNISGISWRLVLLVEEAGVPGENRPNCRNSQQSNYHTITTTATPVTDIGSDNTNLWKAVNKLYTNESKKNFHMIIETVGNRQLKIKERILVFNVLWLCLKPGNKQKIYLQRFRTWQLITLYQLFSFFFTVYLDGDISILYDPES